MDSYKESISNFKTKLFKNKKDHFACWILRNHTFYRYCVYKYYSLYKRSHSFMKYIYFAKYSKYSKLTNVQINCHKYFYGFIFNHYNIVINSNAIIGDNLYCVGNNCIGAGSNGKAPIIGNNVKMGYGAIIIGNVHIADNVTIGAGAIVTKDVSIDGATIIGINKLIEKKDQ